MPIVQVYVFMLGKNLHTAVYCSLLAVMIEFTQVQLGLILCFKNYSQIVFNAIVQNKHYSNTLRIISFELKIKLIISIVK